jgi:hypothetical protein
MHCLAHLSTTIANIVPLPKVNKKYGPDGNPSEK